jgi:hypothetical protein
MSVLGNSTVTYTPSGPGFILSTNAANGTGGMTHTYESNQMDYINAHPIQTVTTGGKRRGKSRRTRRIKKSNKKSRRRR